MSAVVLLLVAVLSASEELSVQVDRRQQTMVVGFELTRPLPEEMVRVLPSGAPVRVAYPLRLRGPRRPLWDRRFWRGEVVAAALFDPVTGRYRCEEVLDGVIVASRELESADQALAWLSAPPPVQLALPEEARAIGLVVRVRAVFSTSTVWLFFPSSEGTEWVEVESVPPAPAEPAAGDE